MKKVFRGSWKKNTVVRRLIMIILVYSAIKIKAKVPLLYSMLNPETSSDSPSAKSKGVRLVSASVVVNQQKNKRGKTSIRGTMFSLTIWPRLREDIIIKGLRRISTILTS